MRGVQLTCQDKRGGERLRVRQCQAHGSARQTLTSGFRKAMCQPTLGKCRVAEVQSHAGIVIDGAVALA